MSNEKATILTPDEKCNIKVEHYHGKEDVSRPDIVEYIDKLLEAQDIATETATLKRVGEELTKILVDRNYSMGEKLIMITEYVAINLKRGKLED